MAVSLSAPILIVDDYNTMVRIVRNLLRQLGFTSIDEASNGSTALAKMRAKKYQLVISKQALAPPSGLEDSAQRPPVLQIGGDAVTAQNLKAKLVSVLGAF